MNLWDESKHPRDSQGRFAFTLGEMLGGLGNKLYNADRRKELAKYERMASRLGTQTRFIEGKNTDAPEMGVIGLQDAYKARVPLPKRLLSLKVPREKSNVAVYYGSDDTVVLNVKSPFWEDAVGGAIKQFQEGFWSSDHPASVVHHEIGHHAHKTRYDSADEWIVDADKKVPSSIVDAVGDDVSIYGTTEVGEFVAETFAGLMNGERYVPEIMEVYDYYKGPIPRG
jgi:hypothetical protein